MVRSKLSASLIAVEIDGTDIPLSIFETKLLVRLDADDKRLALCVIDLKNVTEANASYSAEVCLYAIFLSNWLHTQDGDLTKRFFVSARVYLWRHVEMPQFTTVKASKEGRTITSASRPFARTCTAG